MYIYSFIKIGCLKYSTFQNTSEDIGYHKKIKSQKFQKEEGNS